MIDFLRPRCRGGQSPEGQWFSFRWLGLGWDSLRYKTGIRFIQFGRDPVKFVLYLPKAAQRPRFLLSPMWTSVRKLKRLEVGTARKPLDMTKLWRNYEQQTNWRRETSQPAIESA